MREATFSLWLELIGNLFNFSNRNIVLRTEIRKWETGIKLLFLKIMSYVCTLFSAIYRELRSCYIQSSFELAVYLGSHIKMTFLVNILSQALT